MDRLEIRERVDGMLEEFLGPTTAEEINEGTDVFGPEGVMDSLDRADFVMNIEAQFQIQTDDAQIALLRTVGNAVEMIANAITHRDAAAG